MDWDDYEVFWGCWNGPNAPPAAAGCVHRATVDETTGRLAAGSDRLGALVVRYTYDGLGRLIRAERPDNPADPAAPVLRFNDYYDGVRRLQEDLTISYPDGYPPEAWTERQYVYGPEYVDEFVAQIDKGDAEHPDGHVFYTLQDANYNVVALVGLVGGTWQIVEQYTYEPYGAVVAVDDLVPGSHPVNRVGHQGLFYEHLDGGQGLTTGAIGLYYNRNRWYSPALGRFISRDPNETALPILTAMAMNGEAFSTLAEAFNATSHFADGMNLYQYAKSRPVASLDPAGTELVVTRDWDDIYESVVGNESAYLGVQGAATWGSFWGGNVTALPDFAVAMGGVSQGMSDFADFYAQQVIWLPVEAAIAGFGAYAEYAAVGAGSSRVARLAGTEGHHPIAKFLGGQARQVLTRLPQALHSEFHRRLALALKAKGLTLPIGGVRGSTMMWQALFENNPGSQRRAFDAILDVSRAMDTKYGTSIVQDFWNNVMNRRFFSFM